MIDFESHNIDRVVLSTTASGLYLFNSCFGTFQVFRGSWMDVSVACVAIDKRTYANNLVTTASTTRLPEEQRIVNMMHMLRKAACSGQIGDLAHISLAGRLSDCLTKSSAKPEALTRVVSIGVLANLAMHPPFKYLLQPKA